MTVVFPGKVLPNNLVLRFSSLDMEKKKPTQLLTLHCVVLKQVGIFNGPLRMCTEFSAPLVTAAAPDDVS